MPLRDHFHEPLAPSRSWTAFTAAWATYMAEHLNDRLPEGYFAEPTAQFAIEIDVVQAREVRLMRFEGNPVLDAAVEFVSPGNKDRPAERTAFVSKCAAFLQQGVCLIIVDVVTARRATLHRDLLARVSPGEPEAPTADLFAAAYRPVSRDKQATLEVWHEPLALGRPLPTLPLRVRGGFYLPLDLEATYEHTCRKLRLGGNRA